MRRYIIIGMIVAAAFAAGCKKAGETAQPKSPVVFATDVPEDAMLFNVKIDGIGTKSHFASDASTADGEFAKLEWDEDDDIGVIAVKLQIEGGELVGADFPNSKCGLARIKSLDADGGAVFYCTESDPDWWISEGDTDENSMYVFLAYYPAKGEKHPFELGLHQAEYYKGELDVFDVWTPFFSIPADQDGKSYPSYQVLLNLDINSIYTHAQLAERSSNIVFNGFNPGTSLFHFKMVSGDGTAYSGIEELRIGMLLFEKKIFSEGYNDPETQNWVEIRHSYYGEHEMGNNFFGIAGNAFMTTFFTGFDPTSDEFYALSTVNGLGFPVDLDLDTEHGEAFEINSKLTSDQMISLKFNTPASIVLNPADAEEYYAVTSALTPEFVDDDMVAVIFFQAIKDGEIVAVGEKLLPETGLKPGVQYNFNLALGDYMHMSAQDAGSYTGIETLTQ